MGQGTSGAGRLPSFFMAARVPIGLPWLWLRQLRAAFLGRIGRASLTFFEEDILNAQPLSRTGAQSGQQWNRVTNHAGAVGSLQFVAAPCTMVQGGRAGAFPPQRASLAEAVFAVVRAPVRATQDEITLISQDIDTFLAHVLRARFDDHAMTLSAFKLTWLSKLSRGDLNWLLGGEECLSNCVGRMERADLLALYGGPGLLREEIFAEILDRVRTRFKVGAVRVLIQMVRAMDQRVAQEVLREPMSRIVTLLSAPQLNLRELYQELVLLQPGRRAVSAYLYSLPDDQLEAVLHILDSKLDAAHMALAAYFRVFRDNEIIVPILMQPLREFMDREFH